jgi:hypothetical protein
LTTTFAFVFFLKVTYVGKCSEFEKEDKGLSYPIGCCWYLVWHYIVACDRRGGFSVVVLIFSALVLLITFRTFQKLFQSSRAL